MVLSPAALTLLPLQLLHHPVRPHVTPTALGHVGALKMSVRTPATVRAKADAGIVTTVGASAATGTATSRGTAVEEEEDGTDQGSAHHHEEEEEAMADMTIAIIETTITEEEEGEVRVQHARFRDLTPPPAALLSRTAHHPPLLFFALQAARGPALAPHRAAEEADAPHVPTPPERAVPAARPPLLLTTRMPSKRPWPPPVRV